MAATKQQIEQGKLRAGGNNPVKVTKDSVKRLGQAALIAASFTPIGRTAKIAGIIAKPISKVVQARSVKNTKVVVEKIAKMQEKTKAEKIASNSVKVKPAAIKKDATKENFYERIRNPIKINTNPTKPKGGFGPLKKKLAAADAKAAAKKAAADTKAAAKKAAADTPSNRAKLKPNKPDAAKTQFKNDSSRTRASDRAMKEYEKNVIRHGERPTDPSFGSKLGERAGLNAKLKRKPNLKAE